MTRIVRAEDLTGPPEDVDPAAFLDDLAFDADLELDPEVLAAIPAPGAKIANPRTVTLRMDALVDQRVSAIAKNRGMTLEDYLEELIAIELARRDAIEAHESARQAQTGQHHAA